MLNNWSQLKLDGTENAESLYSLMLEEFEQVKVILNQELASL
jgi:hypothetical protein